MFKRFGADLVATETKLLANEEKNEVKRADQPNQRTEKKSAENRPYREMFRF